ncbi:MAG: aldo/keto reductase, partial [Dehalococcoidia bacterium]
MPELRWGILSTGRIARIFAEQLAESATGRLGAVASRDRDRAGAFAAHFEDVRAHDTYQALLEDGDVDVVYIATPHTEHAEWTLKAMEAGKDVLCEKPLGVNHAEAMAVAAAARRHGRFLMEGFMYRVHPQTERLRRLLDEQAVGTVRHIRASFGYRAPFDAASRLFRPDLAGGGILDVGCYPVSMVRMVAGLAAGTGTLEPEAVAGSARIEGGVDVDAAALLRFPGDVTAHVAAACRLGLENDLEIFGTEGRILVPSPWFCGSDRGPGPWEIRILRQGMEPATISGDEHRGIFTVEADRVAEELARGRRECAAMTPEDSVGNAGVLDAWRREGGLTFPFELPEAGTRTVSRRPLVKGRAAPIPQQRLPGLNMPLSRLVMGCDNQTEMPHAAVMFDHFFEQGGNTFDTAHIYGGGLMERLLGQWLSDRGVRDEIVVIGKGAHTPRNRPEFVGPELGESLERL